MKKNIFYIVLLATVFMFSTNTNARSRPSLSDLPTTWSRVLNENIAPQEFFEVCRDTFRFKCVFGGAAILDKETGLVWEKYPFHRLAEDSSSLFSPGIPWHDNSGGTSPSDAFNHCYTRQVGQQTGSPIRMGWRLPTISELATLINKDTVSTLKLPQNRPYLDVRTEAVSGIGHQQKIKQILIKLGMLTLAMVQ